MAFFKFFDLEEIFDKESLLDAMYTLKNKAYICNKSYRLNKNARISVKTSVGDSDSKEITDSLGQGSFGAYEGVSSQCQNRWSEHTQVL